MTDKKESKKKKSAPGESSKKRASNKRASKKYTPEKNGPESAEKSAAFPVVGLGASAGGLTALRELFSAMPDDTGMVFVVIQHLIPTQKSRTAELLQQKYTNLPVREVTEDIRVVPNYVYVIPPDRDLIISGAMLKVTEKRDPKGMHLPVDTFFTSLAKNYRKSAIGIILSGTGSDGTAGAQEIKAGGGVVFAQAPESAEFDGMPRSAIRSGAVDQVVEPGHMPGALMQYIRHPYMEASDSGDPRSRGLDAVLIMVRSLSGFDFGDFKRDGLARRIQRRMSLRQTREYEEYAEQIKQDPREREALVQDLYVGVTSFYRDPQAWKSLTENVAAPLIQEKFNEPVRIWIPSVSTGEEAYTAAMVFLEEYRRADREPNLQIYATDINEGALEVARKGEYAENVASKLPARLRHRYMVAAPSSEVYRVDKPVRKLVTFARQDLLSDPPFSHLDLIICRNLLIYLKPETQSRLFALFHFALNSGGYLFLGSSEGLGDKARLFEKVDPQWRLFKRADVPIERPVRSKTKARKKHEEDAADTTAESRKQSFSSIAERVILRRHVPASVLVDKEYRVLYLSGAINAYLRFPTGFLGKDLLSLLPEKLHGSIRTLVYDARQEKKPTSRIVEYPPEAEPPMERVRVKADPVEDDYAPDNLVLLTFAREQQEEKPPVEAPAEQSSPHHNRIIKQLHRELDVTRNELRSKIEQLNGSNEELQSSNEELQVSNEELETSREELQSLNEELTTVNSQLQIKIEELENSNNDLGNFISSTDIPSVFLDSDLHIRRFTPAMARYIRFQESDIGRHLEDLAGELIGDELSEEAHRVMETRNPTSRTLRVHDSWFIRKIVPYRVSKNRVDGVVITFWDFTEERNQRLEAERVAARDAAVLEALNEGLVFANTEGQIIEMNPAALRFHGFESEEQAIRELNEYTQMFELYNVEGKRLPLEQWPISRALRLERFTDQEVIVRRQEPGFERIGSYSGTPVFGDRGDHLMSILTIRDITTSKEVEGQLKKAQERYLALFNNHTIAVVHCEILLDEQGNPVDYTHVAVNDAYPRVTGFPKERIEGKPAREAFPGIEYDPNDYIGKFGKVALEGGETQLEAFFEPLQKWFSVYAYSPFRGEFVVLFSDVSDRKTVEESLLEQKKIMEQRAGDLEAANKELESFAYTLSHDLRGPLRSITNFSQIVLEEARDRLGRDCIEYLERIDAAGAKMGEQIQDLLKLTWLSRSRIDRADFNIVQTARDVVGELRKAHPERKVEVAIPDELTVHADARLTHILLQELLGNAWKFTAGTGQARIAVGVEQKNNSQTIYVHDNGGGFKMEHVNALFKPFSRLHGEDQFEGSGMGLAIARRIVELHRGKIWAESEEKKGTTIYFNLGEG